MPNINKIRKITAIAAGGVHTVDTDDQVGIVNITSSTAITLAAAVTIAVSGTPKRGTEIIFRHDGGFTSDTSTGKHLSIFGKIIPDEQALHECKIEAFYNGTSWKVTVFPSVEGNENIDGANIVDGSLGTDAIADDSVTNDKLADIPRGSVKVGGASDAPTNLVAKTDAQILVGDGTDINSVPVSGDITMTNTGAVAIGEGKVTEAMLNDDVNYDSGWKTINDWTSGQGFGLPPYGSAVNPSIRVIGRQVYIQGYITIPLMDGSNAFQSDNGNYGTTHKALTKTFDGANYGYDIYNSTDGYLLSKSPIVPAALYPTMTHTFMRDSFAKRLIIDQAGTDVMVLGSILTSSIFATGKLHISTHMDADLGIPTYAQAHNSPLHSLITNVTAGDFAPDYSGYNTSYTVAIDNRLSPVSTSAYPATLNAEDPADIGGFTFDISTTYLVDPSTSQADIIAAFDSI